MRKIFQWIAYAGAATALATACSAETQGVAAGGDETENQATSPGERVALKRVRLADPDAGRALFVDKGCVICHSVNGTGGKAAPMLDAPVGAPPVDPLEFSARMWRGAPAMVELQAVELGYTISLNAEEIADLAAFAADRDAQKQLTPESLPESIRNGLLDEQFWEMEDWDEILRAGREGEFAPEEGETFSPDPD